MLDLETILMELRLQIKRISDPIQRLSSFENHSDENYTKLLGILNKTYERLIDFLDSVPDSPLFMSNAPNFIDLLRHDIRAPLSVLISAATVIDEKYRAQLNSDQLQAVQRITQIANDIDNYLNTIVQM